MLSDLCTLQIAFYTYGCTSSVCVTEFVTCIRMKFIHMNILFLAIFVFCYFKKLVVFFYFVLKIGMLCVY